MMSENLNKKPPKGILKQSSSFDTNTKGFATPRCSITSLDNTIPPSLSEETVNTTTEPLSPNYLQNRKSSKSAKFDEMNILETLHPSDKDYGHMKIDEPKTPFNYYEDEGESCSSSQKKPQHHHEILIDPEELAKKISEKGLTIPTFMNKPDEDEDEDDDEEDDDNPENREQKKYFESKRKAHYNEYFAVKLARQLMEKEGEEDEEEEEKSAEKFIPEEETLTNDEDLDEQDIAANDF